MGKEVNAVFKRAPLRVALAFPDVYEVGMSHLGLKILYKVINELPFASCERAYHPWVDYEEGLRASGEPLRSLESGSALRDFDVLGFSLQYELSYTSVLNMLELAGIPLLRDEREGGASARPTKFPLLLAGGPCTSNPLPLSDFMDVFLIGDGEEAVPEILQAVYEWKEAGDGGRRSLLEALARIEGVYVPAVFKDGDRPVRRRHIDSLENAPYPDKPVVPFAALVHDRVNIEVSRGCPMGCRFCQAGMIYRPLRERSPGRVLELAEAGLRHTGHDEVSFTSLSAGDYGRLLPLLREFNKRFSGRKINISLPSIRVKALTADVVKEIKSVRKTGFTIAPEAATARLRAVINKDFGEEDYERAINALFREGWQGIKLYYMLGLPTETDADVEAIPGMAYKALQAAKRHRARDIKINVGISSYVPKPHTPFERCGQDSLQELLRKKAYLKSALRRRGLQMKDHDEKMSLLEAAISRGDAHMGKLLLEARKLGARLDAWGEHFDYDKWLRAMERTGIDAARYAGRVYAKEEKLPWQIVDPGVTGEFLLREYENALSLRQTGNCLEICSACGLDCKTERGQNEDIAGATPQAAIAAPDNALTAPDKIVTSASEGKDILKEEGGTRPPGPPSRLKPAGGPCRLRVCFSKKPPLDVLSHREMITAITRAARRAGLPLEHTSGFHPAPKIALGPALPVGVKGEAEYFDISLLAAAPELKDALNGELPEGLHVESAIPLPPGAASLQSFISLYEYEIIGIDSKKAGEFEAADGPVIIKREKGEVDLRKNVFSLHLNGTGAKLVLADSDAATARLEEAVLHIFGMPMNELGITRTRMLGRHAGQWRSPMEVCGA